MKRSVSTRTPRNLSEDKRAVLKNLCEGMNLQDRLLTEEIYNEFHDIGRMISEAQLTQDQIQQLFKVVSDGAARGFNVDLPGGDPEVGPGGEGENKTLLGKISGAWQKLKSKIAQSGPVSGFDVTVDKLQQQIIDKSGPDGKVTKAIAAYRKFGDKHPIMQGAIIAGLTAAAAMGGGLGLGAVAGVAGGLRTLDRMLMGDRASSALWKGFKAGALTYGVGKLIQAPDTTTTTTTHTNSWGGEQSGGYSHHANNTAFDQLGGAAPAGGGDAASTGMQTIAAQKGDTLSQIAQKMHVSTKDLLQANPQITNPNDLGLGEIIKLPGATGNAVYQGGVGTASDTAAKVASGQYTPSRFGIKESIDWDKIDATFAIQESLKMPLQSAVYLTPYGVQQVMETIEKYQDELDEGIWDAIKSGWNTAKNKITTDKLDLYWRRNRGENPTEGPVDKQVVVDFLKKMGVKSGLIDRAFRELNIPDTVAPNDVQQARGRRRPRPQPQQGGGVSPPQDVTPQDSGEAPPQDSGSGDQGGGGRFTGGIKMPGDQQGSKDKRRSGYGRKAAGGDPYEVAKSQVRQIDAAKGGRPLPDKMAAGIRSDLRKLAAGDKDSGAYAADKILKFAQAGYDVSKLQPAWIGASKAGERVMETALYHFLSQMLQEHGLTWGDLGLRVRLVEGIDDVVYISRIDEQWENELHRMRQIAGLRKD